MDLKIRGVKTMKKENKLTDQFIQNACDLCKIYDADGVKLYLKSGDNYSIKIIKDDKIIKRIRKGHSGPL